MASAAAVGDDAAAIGGGLFHRAGSGAGHVILRRNAEAEEGDRRGSTAGRGSAQLTSGFMIEIEAIARGDQPCKPARHLCATVVAIQIPANTAMRPMTRFAVI